MTFSICAFPVLAQASLTFIGHAEAPAPQSSPVTFSIPFDTPNTNRWLVAGVGIFGGSPDDISAVTIGGIAATLIAHAGGGGYAVAIYAAKVPTNTTQTVVATISGGFAFRGACALYDLSGVKILPNVIATASGLSNPVSATLSVPANGAVIGFSFTESPTANAPVNWVGIAKDFQANFDSTTWANTAAHQNFTTAQPSLSVSVTNTGATPLMHAVFAVFGP